LHDCIDVESNSKIRPFFKTEFKTFLKKKQISLFKNSQKNTYLHNYQDYTSI